jgi:hypothetical protein
MNVLDVDQFIVKDVLSYVIRVVFLIAIIV